MWERLRWWLRRDREERDLEEEIRAHLAIETRQRVQSGDLPETAAADARRSFGNVARISEETRESWGFAVIERFFEDVCHGIRIFRRTPVWTAVVGATLALGIGLSTAIFSVVYGVVLKPLSYREPDRLMALWNVPPTGDYQRFNVSGLNWLTWRARAKSFEDIALARLIRNFNLTGEGAPERLQAASTSWNLLQVLGVSPLMGRAFTEAEENADAHVAVLSYWLWQRRFGEDPRILGRRISLNGEPYEVIGVMPESFQYPTAQFELWTPLFLALDDRGPDGGYNFAAVGRLKHGVSAAQAQAEMSAIARQSSKDYPISFRSVWEYLDVQVEPLLASDTLSVRSPMWVLLAAVGSLLLTGCFNLSTLLIARASSRRKEMAVRTALGADATRIRQQILAEVIPLSLAGAAGGVLLAWLLLRRFLPLLPQIPRAESAGLNGPVLAFTTIVSFAVVLLAALLPSRAAARLQLAPAMQRHTRLAGARSFLVVAQVAITIVLLFGGILFARSLAAVLRVNPGFTTQNILTMQLAVTRAKHRKDSQIAEFYDRILTRVGALPGVAAAGFVNRLALSGIPQTLIVEFESRPDLAVVDVDSRSVTRGYFEAAGIPLKQGRDFTLLDRSDSPPVGIIDEQLARRAFGSESPLGQRFRVPIADQPWVEIVGVVGHILNDTPEKDTRPQVYWPEWQRTQDRAALVVRATGPPESLTSAIIRQIREEDPDQPVYDVRTMDEWMSRALGTRNLMTWLVGIFGGASLVLACLGLYGVVSYATGLRMREFGIRMALGATVTNIRGLVFGQAGKLVLYGCLLGLALALLSGRAIATLLYGVGSWDATAMVAAVGILIAVALAASAGPALRAAKTDPAAALRLE